MCSIWAAVQSRFLEEMHPNCEYQGQQWLLRVVLLSCELLVTRCQPFRDRAAAITRELRQDAQTQVNDVILLDLKRMRILLIEHSGRLVSARHKCAWLKTKALQECTLCKHGILWSPYTDWFSDGLAFFGVFSPCRSSLHVVTQHAFSTF